MDKLKQTLENELKKFNSKLPISDGSILGYKNRVEAVMRLKDDYLKIINQIGNDFVIENNSKGEEIENIKGVCQDYLNKFLVSFGK